MKITLHNTPDGYKAEAELRSANTGEPYIGSDMQVHIAPFNTVTPVPVLTPKRQRAEVRRYWATVKSTGIRKQLTKRNEAMAYMEGSIPYRVNELTGITPIDPEYLDAPPVPVAPPYATQKADREEFEAAFDNGEIDLADAIRMTYDRALFRVGASQPPAPSVTRTDVGESEGAK
jgi:hypothetical protein